MGTKEQLAMSMLATMSAFMCPTWVVARKGQKRLLLLRELLAAEKGSEPMRQSPVLKLRLGKYLLGNIRNSAHM